MKKMKKLHLVITTLVLFSMTFVIYKLTNFNIFEVNRKLIKKIKLPQKGTLVDSLFSGHIPDDEYKGYHYSISNEFYDKDVNVKEYSNFEKSVEITTNYSFIFDSNSIVYYDYFIHYVIWHIQDYDDINLQGYHFTFTLVEFYFLDETKNYQYNYSTVINNIEICKNDEFPHIDCNTKIRYSFTSGGIFQGKYSITKKEVETKEQ